MARSSDINALIVRALTSPQNVLPAAAVAGVGLAFGLWPLYLAAVVVYAASAVATLRSPAEARKVLAGRRVVPAALEASPELQLADREVARLYSEARVETERLAGALADSPLELPEVRQELTGMSADLVTLCRNADRVSAYLGSVDTDDLRRRRDAARAKLAEDSSQELRSALARSVEALTDQLTLTEALGDLRGRFTAEAEALVSSLASIRGEVVRIGVSAGDADGAGERLRRQVGGAREDMRRLSSAISERVALGVAD